MNYNNSDIRVRVPAHPARWCPACSRWTSHKVSECPKIKDAKRKLRERKP